MTITEFRQQFPGDATISFKIVDGICIASLVLGHRPGTFMAVTAPSMERAMEALVDTWKRRQAVEWKMEMEDLEGADIVPLCQTCRLWGQGACKIHQQEMRQ